MMIMVKIFPMTRFAMSHPSRIHGLIAVNPTSSKASPALGMIKVFVFLFVFADLRIMNVSSYFDIHQVRSLVGFVPTILFVQHFHTYSCGLGCNNVIVFVVKI